MAYDDRDYSRERAVFDAPSPLPWGSRSLIIAAVAAFIICAIAADAIDFTGERFFSRLESPGASFVQSAFILEPRNLVPWAADSFEPQPWKVLTHWLLEPSLIAIILSCLALFFVGRLAEPVLGTRRYMSLFVVACVGAGALSCVLDGAILPGRPVAILGMGAGLTAVLVPLTRLVPGALSFFNLRLSTVIWIFVAVMVLLPLLFAGRTSPTQNLFGALLGGAYLLAFGRHHSPLRLLVREEAEGEEWKRGSVFDNLSKEERAALDAERKRKAEEDERERADRARVDEILEKISRSGIDSLTRRERSFLDEHSKKVSRR
jgi:membrane associated rhomboid family serine protease